jgi:hypothetical protein
MTTSDIDIKFHVDWNPYEKFLLPEMYPEDGGISTTKTEAAGFSEALVTTYKTTLSFVPEDYNRKCKILWSNFLRSSVSDLVVGRL